jgi:hypothetical protein
MVLVGVLAIVIVSHFERKAVEGSIWHNAGSLNFLCLWNAFVFLTRMAWIRSWFWKQDEYSRPTLNRGHAPCLSGRLPGLAVHHFGGTDGCCPVFGCVHLTNLFIECLRVCLHFWHHAPRGLCPICVVLLALAVLLCIHVAHSVDPMVP